MLKLLLDEHISPDIAAGLVRRNPKLLVRQMTEWESADLTLSLLFSVRTVFQSEKLFRSMFSCPQRALPLSREFLPSPAG